MITCIFNIILVILGILSVCGLLFFALVIYLIGKGFDNREKEAQELLGKDREQSHEEDA